MNTWNDVETPDHGPIRPMGWVRIVIRGLILGSVTFGCLAVLLLVRLVERPIWGAARPITPKITKFVCRTAFRVLGMRLKITGTPAEGRGAAVANHSSWLDIFALNAHNEIYFLAKSEVAAWPGIGWLARATGTMFVVRDRRHAQDQRAELQTRLSLGHRLLFFPEGTSTDGLQVEPFKPTLFQALVVAGKQGDLPVQAVTLKYTAPPGEDARFYGWWGDMSFGGHLLHTLSVKQHGQVEVIYHPSVDITDATTRKGLALELHGIVASGLD